MFPLEAWLLFLKLKTYMSVSSLYLSISLDNSVACKYCEYSLSSILLLKTVSCAVIILVLYSQYNLYLVTTQPDKTILNNLMIISSYFLYFIMLHTGVDIIILTIESDTLKAKG